MLAPDHDDRLGGGLSHIIVMQHVTKARLKEFIDDLEAEISANLKRPSIRKVFLIDF